MDRQGSAARQQRGSGVRELGVTEIGRAGETFRTDMPSGIGGTASAPSPGWFLRAAIASCVASLIGIRAAATGAAIGAVRVEVDSESDDRGILGLDDAIPAGALSTRIVVSIESPDLDPAARRELVAWAVAHCAVSESISRAVALEIEVG